MDSRMHHRPYPIRPGRALQNCKADGGVMLRLVGVIRFVPNTSRRMHAAVGIRVVVRAAIVPDGGAAIRRWMRPIIKMIAATSNGRKAMQREQAKAAAQSCLRAEAPSSAGIGVGRVIAFQIIGRLRRRWNDRKRRRSTHDGSLAVRHAHGVTACGAGLHVVQREACASRAVNLRAIQAPLVTQWRCAVGHDTEPRRAALDHDLVLRRRNDRRRQRVGAQERNQRPDANARSIRATVCSGASDKIQHIAGV